MQRSALPDIRQAGISVHPSAQQVDVYYFLLITENVTAWSTFSETAISGWALTG
jgi:hypothetical protein